MQTIDFLPDYVHQQRIRRIRVMRQGYILALVAILLVGIGYIFHYRVTLAEADLAVAEKKGVNLKMQLATLRQLERQKKDLEFLQIINKTLGSRVVAVDVLAELNRVVPASVFLTQLDLETEIIKNDVEPADGRRGRRPLSKTDKRLRLVINGIAAEDGSVWTFVRKLNESRLFEDVKMQYSKSVKFGSREAREFQVSCFVAR